MAEELELHYTAKHDNWLNIAEIELSVHSLQRLDRLVTCRSTRERELRAW
jgi:hypothetical protein